MIEESAQHDYSKFEFCKNEVIPLHIEVTRVGAGVMKWLCCVTAKSSRSLCDDTNTNPATNFMLMYTYLFASVIQETLRMANISLKTKNREP